MPHLPRSANGGVLVGTPGTGGTSAPFAGEIQYQQVYNSSQFAGTVSITGITFFDTDSFTGGFIDDTTYTISLSTTSRMVNGLAADFASNRGNDAVDVFSGTLTSAIGVATNNGHLVLAGDELTFSFAPFVYDPDGGNLLMEIIKLDDPSTSTISLDSNPGDGLSTDRFSNVRSLNDDGNAETTEARGLVALFQTEAHLPEPSTITLACLAAAGFSAHRLRRRRKATG